jgi:non-ribosomal peptide synthetase component F
MIPHEAICNHMLWMRAAFPLTEADRVLQKTPFSFDASVWEFYAPLLAGATLIMAKPHGHQDAAYLVNLIANEQVTILQLVPTLLQVLLDEPEFQNCRSLKHVFCGGEALTTELKERFFAQLTARRRLPLTLPSGHVIGARSSIPFRLAGQSPTPGH